jgi:hypothetical protein
VWVAQLSGEQVVAVDLHMSFLNVVPGRACGVRQARLVVRMSMKALGFCDESFDVIWSEGAVYIAGSEAGLRDWLREYYGPMAARIASLREKYRGDRETLQQLDAEEDEIEIYRRYSEWYGYVFYVMQKQRSKFNAATNKKGSRHR